MGMPRTTTGSAVASALAAGGRRSVRARQMKNGQDAGALPVRS
jgi:hypothetical protein